MNTHTHTHNYTLKHISKYLQQLANKQPMQPKYPSNNRRDLAYKPSIPQGWNAPPVVFAKGKILKT